MTLYYAIENGTNSKKLSFFLEYSGKVSARLHKIFAQYVFEGKIPLKNILDSLIDSHKELINDLKNILK